MLKNKPNQLCLISFSTQVAVQHYKSFIISFLKEAFFSFKKPYQDNRQLNTAVRNNAEFPCTPLGLLQWLYLALL